MNYIAIAAGGGIGAVFRYLSVQAVNGWFGGKLLLGTIVVNCAGALAIGFLMSVFDAFAASPKWKLFAVTWFLGGYTTFSAYSYETVNYLMDGSIKYAVINIALSNALCLLFVFAGILLGRAVFLR